MSSRDALAEVLSHGDIDIDGRLPGASNATLRGTCLLDGITVPCVYKPRRGERPLWDFADGSLGHREVATFIVSQDIGWDLVPETVWRETGPYGPGMCQLWVDSVDTHAPVDVVALGSQPPGWLEVAEGDGIDGRPVALVHEDSRDLQRLALLDAIINNADRKGGHVLRAPSGRPIGIDHGLTFHEESKLRTVLWGWAGQVVEGEDLEVLSAVSRRWSKPSGLSPLMAHLTPREIEATALRCSTLVASARFPRPEGMWPALPWPAM